MIEMSSPLANHYQIASPSVSSPQPKPNLNLSPKQVTSIGSATSAASVPVPVPVPASEDKAASLSASSQRPTRSNEPLHFKVQLPSNHQLNDDDTTGVEENNK